MHYDLKGQFFEACDCEIICSCWNEVDTVMGQCTGLFVWKFGQHSTVDGVDVEGTSVAIITHGDSCDDGRHVLLVIAADGENGPRHDHLLEAFDEEAGAWNQVFDFPKTDRVFESVAGDISWSSTGSMVAIRASLDTPDRSVEAIANASFGTGIKLDGQSAAARTPDPASSNTNSSPLIRRVAGTAAAVVEAGAITLASAISGGEAVGIGLSILGDVLPGSANAYRFDIDLTTVSAMRGKFHYSYADK